MINHLLLSIYRILLLYKGWKEMHRIFIEKSTKVSKEKGTRPLFIRGFCSIAEKDKKNEKNSKKVLHKWSFCCIIYER
nr:MAG TPA: hypothetical protein [Caudoviricetes sp.]